MGKQKSNFIFLIVVICTILMLPVSTIASSGGIDLDYSDSELVDSNEPKSEKKSSNTNENNIKWLPNWLENAIDSTKKTIGNTSNGIKEVAFSGFDLIKDKTNQGIDWIGDKLKGISDWWGERSLIEKSLLILGTGATILTGGVALGVISAGAAVFAGISGAVSYGLYALNNDDVSLGGGLGMMTVGAFGGIGLGALRGIGVLGARGSSIMTAVSKGTSHSRMGGFIKNGMNALGQTRVGSAILRGTSAAVRAARPVLGLLSSKGALTGGAISSVFAGGAHVYNTLVNGEPLDSKAMINDMVVWGAAGVIGVGLASKAFHGMGAITKSKGLKTASSATVGGTSEYALGNLFEGKSPGIKKTLMVAGLSLTLGGAIAFGPLVGNFGKQMDNAKTVVSKGEVANTAEERLLRKSSGLSPLSSSSTSVEELSNFTPIENYSINYKINLQFFSSKTELKPDINIGVSQNSVKSKAIASETIEELKVPISTYEERLSQTPLNNGKWTGQRGESTFISENVEVTSILKNVDRKGIEYAKAIPDFSPVSRVEVEIPNMSTDRRINFRSADERYAEKLGVTRKEVIKMRKTQRLTWHELNDMKTMQLVPTEINSKFGHLGGVAEVKKSLK